METTKRNNAKLTIKLVLILLISIILLIPQAIIQSMINERHSTEAEASEEVANKWGANPSIKGPVIFIPGNKAENNVYIMPEQLNIDGEVMTRQLKRGIYDFTVFESELKFEGSFVLPHELSEAQKTHLKWNQARLLFGVADFRGFTDNPAATLDGTPIQLAAEGYKLGSFATISCPINIDKMAAGGKMAFDINIPLKGSNNIRLLPVGRTTKVKIASDCKTPSFDGRYLPIKRNITENGFTAEWSVLALNRDFAQVVNGSSELSGMGVIEVGLRVPVEQYQKTMRSIKYAYLIILLTFAVVFFTENRRHTQIHPVQYALIGIALILYYTLLLSIAEHCSFILAYLVASAMTIGLITLFMRSILHNSKAALAIGGLLTVLYAFIYILMNMESYALLVGSIGVFCILAIAMYASQKINWYQK